MSRQNSWMFVPAQVQRLVAKALGFPADVIMLDLEDSVVPTQKAAARALISEKRSSLKQDGTVVIDYARSVMVWRGTDGG